MKLIHYHLEAKDQIQFSIGVLNVLIRMYFDKCFPFLFIIILHNYVKILFQLKITFIIISVRNII